jgi:ComF family protein
LLLQEIAYGLVHLFYPRLCEGCNKPLLGSEDVLCLGCGLQLPKTAYHDIEDNDTATRLAGRVPFIYATSFAYFTNDGLLQHLLHGLKYTNKKEIGIYLGKQFANDLLKNDWIRSIDVIVPVPLHAKKEAARGYNQSVLIGEGMSEVLHIPLVADKLIRTRQTESQTQKTRSQRLENMKDAFLVMDAATLTGKHILLIDDVLTTGATLEACALALLQVQDLKLSIATIGIA